MGWNPRLAEAARKERDVINNIWTESIPSAVKPQHDGDGDWWWLIFPPAADDIEGDDDDDGRYGAF